ncbi:MAG: ATP-binding protein [Catenulispora sp.]|nr:ATP-binding protein [Catenulispora sp.]
MQQLRHPAPACRASGSEAGGGVAAREAGAEPAGSRDPQSTALYWSFPGTALDVSLSRRWLAAAARELWGAGDDTDRLVLAYSEVATNAVVHGAGPVTVCAHIHPGGATCEVADCSARVPQPRRAALEDDSGRGLALVAQTVDRLGVRADETGKTVRFEVGRAAPESGRSPLAESGGGPLAEAEGAIARAVDAPRPVPGRRHRPAPRNAGAGISSPGLSGTSRSSVGGPAGGPAVGKPPRLRSGPLGARALGELGG